MFFFFIIHFFCNTHRKKQKRKTFARCAEATSKFILIEQIIVQFLIKTEEKKNAKQFSVHGERAILQSSDTIFSGFLSKFS